MKPALNIRLLVISFIAVFGCLFPALSASGQNQPGSNMINHPYVKGELLVKYKPSPSSAISGYYRDTWNIRPLRRLRSIGVHHVRLPGNITVEEALGLFKEDPDVEYAEPNYYIYSSVIPTDPFFDRLWGLHNTGQEVNGTAGTPDADVDAAEAWDINTGDAGVLIAVLDTGVDYNHPDLSGNIWINPGETGQNGNDEDGNGYIDDVRGWDFVDGDNNPIDPNGHGTHVAGTIAAARDDTTGVTGVCWKAGIIPLRILNAFGIGSTSDAISAIEYAEGAGANIINNSWGGSGDSKALKEAIESSRVLFVCSAGNNGTDNDAAPDYPSSYSSPNIISVAATNQDDELAYFSSYGETSVDIGAPGVNIYSDYPARQTIWFEDFEGTLDWAAGGVNNTWNKTGDYGHDGSGHSLAESPGTDYAPDTDSYAGTPLIDLSSHEGDTLLFWVRGSARQGDYFYVQASDDGNNWVNLQLQINNDLGIFWTGTSSDFVKAIADLGAYDGENSLYLRFCFYSDSDADVAEGFFFDDVSIEAASTSYGGTEYRFFDGTSMAAPHVSGVAALLKSQYPSLTSTQIKKIMEDTADPLDSLRGKTVTGGRVNAVSALLPLSPGNLSAQSASASRIDVQWSDNSLNESGFRIERKTEPGNYTRVDSVGKNVETYSDTKLEESTTYHYRVFAYSTAGDSDYSNQASALTLPAAPTNLSAEAVSGERIDLSWTDNSSGESGFKIERRQGTEGSYAQIATTDSNITEYSDTGLKGGTTYYFRIFAYSTAGDSDYSNQASAKTSGFSASVSGNCFIATAAFGSPMEKHVTILKEFRRRFLVTTWPGRKLVDLYNRWSPPLAGYISKSRPARITARCLLYPAVGMAYMALHARCYHYIFFLLLLLPAITIFIRARKRKAQRTKNQTKRKRTSYENG